ncbi:MAG: hypothetical protein HQL65_07500 [Magnetococcales bacterium]|nr:hypothetical protein [Magnetococcales bacterium]
MNSNRFVAVLGSSGSGKSSLVRTGVLNALEVGLLPGVGGRWRFLIFRPADNPLLHLAEQAIELEGNTKKFSVEHVVALMQRGRDGFVTFLKEIEFNRDQPILILVDQFEEIFRHQVAHQQREFVNNLLYCVLKDVPYNIFVILTMRSEYEGNCAVFQDLPGMINRGHFLIPRLSLENLREAIEGPARLFKGSTNRDFTDQLIDDLKWEPFQLPILQHCLFRAWQEAKSKDPNEPTLIKATLDGLGGTKRMLSNHGNQVFAELPNEREKEICRRLFCALVDRRKGIADTRRPVQVAKLLGLTGGSIQDLESVIKPFACQDVYFLTVDCKQDETLRKDHWVDITHESLIYLWDSLGKWVAEEMENISFFQRIEDKAKNWKKSKHKIYLDSFDADKFKILRNEEKWNYSLAEMYGIDWESVNDFTRHDLNKKTKQSIYEKVAVVVVIAFSFMMAYFFHNSSENLKEKNNVLLDKERDLLKKNVELEKAKNEKVEIEERYVRGENLRAESDRRLAELAFQQSEFEKRRDTIVELTKKLDEEKLNSIAIEQKVSNLENDVHQCAILYERSEAENKRLDELFNNSLSLRCDYLVEENNKIKMEKSELDKEKQKLSKEIINKNSELKAIKDGYDKYKKIVEGNPVSVVFSANQLSDNFNLNEDKAEKNLASNSKNDRALIDDGLKMYADGFREFGDKHFKVASDYFKNATLNFGKISELSERSRLTLKSIMMLGYSHYEDGEFDAAAVQFGQSISILETNNKINFEKFELNPSELKRYINLYWYHGLSLKRLDDLKKSIVSYQKALGLVNRLQEFAAIDKNLPADERVELNKWASSKIAGMNLGIGALARQLGMETLSLQSFETAFRLLTPMVNEDPPQMLESFIWVSVVEEYFRKRVGIEKALALALKYVDQNKGKKGEQASLHTLAIAQCMAGDCKKALETYKKVLDLIRNSNAKGDRYKDHYQKLKDCAEGKNNPEKIDWNRYPKNVAGGDQSVFPALY